MKVKTSIDILENIIKILKQYENYSINAIFDDINSKISNNNHNEAKDIKKGSSDINFDNVILEIQQLDNDKISSYLSKYKKDDLISIGKCINLELKKSDKKNTLIESIVNHYSFIKLNGMMANRVQRSKMGVP